MDEGGKNPVARVVLAGSTRAVRPGAVVLGVADPHEWIEVTIKVRRKKPLPGWGAFPAGTMTRDQLAADYGADPADMEKVKTVLGSLGLRVLRELPAACSIRVGGPAAVVENVFGVRLF